MKKTFKRMGALACAAGLMLSGAVEAAAYNDFEDITSHVNLVVPQQLDITKPSGNITTAAANYYIMGNSDPSQPLYLNGHLVENRGQFGSFGVYVALGEGQNLVEMTQDNATDRVIITRAQVTTAATTTTLTERFPTYDTAYRAGEELSIACVAPSGAQVTANLNGTDIPLGQVATAQQGVPARFRAAIRLPDADGTASLGNIRYTMSYNGKTTTYTSAGQLFVAGGNSPLRVQVTQVSAAVLNGSGNGYATTAKLGAVDTVVDMNADQYRLSMGGWISRANVRPLSGTGSVQNNVSSVSFRQEDGGESYILSGTNNPIATTLQTADKLAIELHNTTGVGSIPVENSRLFTSARAGQTQNGSTVLEFDIDPSATLWGYVVEYQNGVTSIYCKYRPRLSGDSQYPLSGIVVALDGGHGSADPGALGPSQTKGPTESDINRATAVAVKKRLESLGATVYLPDPLDLNDRFNERMQPALDHRADVFISLHSNSIAANSNGLLPNGIEIYYYELSGHPLGAALLTKMTAYTGRASRGVKPAAFRVTLNSLAPSVLVEMGFMTNPIEYDNLCSRQGVYSMANAVGDGLVAFLS